MVAGVSKSYSWTGGRIGWAVFPTAEEAAVFRNLNINYFSCVPAYNQDGARWRSSRPRARRRSPAWWRRFQHRRDLVVPGLNAIPGIACQTPRGAFYVFPEHRRALPNPSVIIAAHKALPTTIRERTSPSTLFQMFLLFQHHVATHGPQILRPDRV